jgi:hypothetical protein
MPEWIPHDADSSVGRVTALSSQRRTCCRHRGDDGIGIVDVKVQRDVIALGGGGHDAELVDLGVASDDDWDDDRASQWRNVEGCLATIATDPQADEIRAVRDRTRRD